MIRKFTYGEPIYTGAVPEKIEENDETLPFFDVSSCDGTVSFLLTLDDDDMIFGLGENVRGLNKRGFVYRSWNSDDGRHTETTSSLYASHNFLIFYGKNKLFGAFFDDPGKMVFDLGYSSSSISLISSKNGNLDVYIIESSSMREIVHEFRQLTGRSYIPPKWAFGYMQSRWGYAGTDDVMTVLKEHRKRHIPLDGICLDIDYMDNFKDFTTDKEKIQNLTELCHDTGTEHVHLVPIIDAGVKKEKGYSVYDEGHEKGYFCKKADGTDFVCTVWPGDSCFPDFMSSDVRTWFGSQYHKLMECGIEGFWNDMNEPALFASEAGVEKLRQFCADAAKKDDGYAGLKPIVYSGYWIQNSMEDYCSFYQNVDGKKVRHDKVHNLYGAKMAQAAAEGFHSFNPGKRFLLFSRSSYIGSHRDGGVWQGDNASWWSHLLMEMKMLTSLNMCGYLYNGADIGGFNEGTSPDLLLRWLELGIFTPLMRNHCSNSMRNQEVYQFDNCTQLSNMITCRYALLPYIYSEFMKAALSDGMMFSPLAFDYADDEIALRTEDQVLLGDDCMIAPVYEQNARGRMVYLPEDMLCVRLRRFDDYDCTCMKAGHNYIHLALDEAALFIKKGHIVPLARDAAEYVDQVNGKNLTLLGWIGKDCTFSLYDDDGYTTSPSLEAGTTAFAVKVSPEGAYVEDTKGYSFDCSKIIVEK